MATAAIIDSKKVEAQRHRNLPAPRRALRRAARALLRLPGVDVVRLAVRESRTQAAVIRCGEGTRSSAGLELTIGPGVGAGGAVLLMGEPWQGEVAGNGASRLSKKETALLAHEGAKHVMVIPLRTTGLRGEVRLEGIAYAAARRRVGWSDKTLKIAQRAGERVARAVRDAQRVSEVTQRWVGMWAQLAASGEAADLRLDRVARQIAADVRAVLRSGIGIVFRLDAASGALHSLGLDGEVIPGEIVPAVRRGQVLPPGYGCAGRAVALGKPFVAPDDGSGCVDVPRLAGSLTQSLSVSAVCEQLVRSVLALVRGNGATIWNAQGQIMSAEAPHRLDAQRHRHPLDDQRAQRHAEADEHHRHRGIQANGRRSMPTAQSNRPANPKCRLLNKAKPDFTNFLRAVVKSDER